MIGIVLTVILFVLIAPQSREFLLTSATGLSAWAARWAPGSYVILMAILFAPLVSWYMVARGPKVKPEEDPLARYKRAEDVITD